LRPSCPGRRCRESCEPLSLRCARWRGHEEFSKCRANMQMSRKALIRMIILLERKMRTVSADTCPDSPDALKGPPHCFERRRRQQPARTQTLRQPCSVHCVHDGVQPPRDAFSCTKCTLREMGAAVLL